MKYTEEEHFVYNEPFDGYTLFTPWFSTMTYLITNNERVVHTWKSQYKPALSVYLLKMNYTIIKLDLLENQIYKILMIFL